MNKYSVYSKTGKFIYECLYDEVFSFIKDDGILKIKLNGLYGFIDAQNGNIIAEPKYQKLSSWISGYCIAMKNNFYGAINKKGDEVVSFEYDEIGAVFGNFYFARKKKKYNLFDFNGNVIDEGIEESLSQSGFIKAKKNGKWGFISDIQKPEINYEYESIATSEDYLYVVKQSGKGLFNKSFDLLIPCVYSNIDVDYRNQTAIIKKDSLYGIFDIKSRTEIFNCQFKDKPVLYRDKYMLSESNKKFGIIDIHRKIVIDYNYDEISSFDGDIFVGKSNKSFSLINIRNEVLSKYKYQKMERFKDDLMSVKRNGKWGYIDKSGNEIIKCQFEDAYNFSYYHAFVKLNGSWSLIDKKGDIVFDYQLTDFLTNVGKDVDFRNNLMLANKNGKYGVLDTSYTVVLDFQFSKFSQLGFIQNSLIGCKDQKYGVYDTKGKQLIENIYDEIDLVDDLYFFCCTNNVSSESVTYSLESLNVKKEFDRDFIINFYKNDYLKIEELNIETTQWIRISILALVEKYGDLLTNKLYVIDAAHENGNTATFIQGYTGGGLFSECHFWNEKILNDMSDAHCVDDEGTIPLFTTEELPQEIIEIIKPYTCEINEEIDSYQFSSLENFKKQPYENIYVLYRTWVNKNKSLKSLWSNDRIRLKNMIEKSGIRLSDPTKW